jgi:nitrilase
MRIFKAAGVQLGPVLYNREGTVEKVMRKIHEVGKQGVQFATFCCSAWVQLRKFEGGTV